MSSPRPGLVVSLILMGELIAFVLIWLTGTLDRFGPALVVTVMSANLLIVGSVLWAIMGKRKP